MTETKSSNVLPKIDHVGIAVKDLAQAAKLYIEILGGRLVAGGTNDTAQLRTLFVEFPGGGKLELLQSLGDTPIGRFVEKRGEGMHHMTMLVSDVTGLSERLKMAGYRVVDEDFSQPSWQELYISPKSATGCLLQLVKVGPEYGAPVAGITVEDVLADRWEWVDQQPRMRR